MECFPWLTSFLIAVPCLQKPNAESCVFSVVNSDLSLLDQSISHNVLIPWKELT